MNELDKKLQEINRIANLTANYEKTLLLLAALKDGSVTLDDFDLVDGGWNLKPAFVPVKE